MESIKLTIEYKTGLILEQIVHYINFENNKLCFSLKKQISSCGADNLVRVSLENIKSFNVTETDKKWQY